MNKILESVKDKLSFLNAIFILPICRLVLGEKAFNELVKENNENAEKQVLKDTPIKQDKKEDKNTTQEKDKTNDQKEITEKPENTKENIPEKTNVNEHIDLNDKVPEDMIPKVGDIVTPDCEYDYADEGCYEIDGFTLQESLYDMMERHCEMEQREMYTAAVPVEDNYPYYDTLEGQGDVVNDFREMLADAEYCDDVIVAPESVYDNSTALNEDFYCDMTLDEIEQYDMAENNYYMEMAENMPDYEDYDYDR